jgi:hypothetical protein
MAHAAARVLRLRLVHNGVQPGKALDEPLDFGLQDIKGGIHAGTPEPDGKLGFDLTLDVHPGVAPIFRGPFAQGAPSVRFLYLSWKRRGEHEHPYGWRIKIPLGAIGWNEIDAATRPGMCIMADVTGRRPHMTAPIAWATVPISTGADP